jgi:hypothetical protein
MLVLSDGSEGTSFVLSFPPAESATSRGIDLSICTRSYDDVIVDLTAVNGFTGTSTDVASLTVSATSCQTVTVPSNLRMKAGDRSTVRRKLICQLLLLLKFELALRLLVGCIKHCCR